MHFQYIFECAVKSCEIILLSIPRHQAQLSELSSQTLGNIGSSLGVGMAIIGQAHFPPTFRELGAEINPQKRDIFKHRIGNGRVIILKAPVNEDENKHRPHLVHQSENADNRSSPSKA